MFHPLVWHHCRYRRQLARPSSWASRNFMEALQGPQKQQTVEAGHRG